MAIPYVDFDVDNEVFINDTFSINMKFSNTGSDIGFAPFYDVLLPPGIDFAGGNSDVSFVGNWSNDDSYWTNGSNQEITTHSKLGVPIPANQIIDGIKWYTVEIPYSSYGPDQPVLDITKNLTTSESDGAIIGQALTVQVIPHFELGHDAVRNINTDPVISGTTQTTDITPQLILVRKRNNAPESEIATGENFPFTVTLNVSFAEGQEFHEFIITDTLTDTLQFIPGSLVLPTDFSGLTEVFTTPTTNQYKVPQTLGDTLEFNYNGLIDSDGGSKTITIQYQVYVPYKDSLNDIILSETHGTSRTISNSVSVSGQYRKFETDDDLISANGSNNDSVTAKSIAIQKSNNSGSYSLPNDVVTYTLNLQMSDFFAFDNLNIEDVLSDGQSFVGTTANYSLTEYGNTTNGTINVNTSLVDFETKLDFAISSDIQNLIKGGQVVQGSTIESAGSNQGATTLQITYQAQIDTSYKGTYDNPEMDIGDFVTNLVKITSTNYDFVNNTSYGNNVLDMSNSTINVGNISINKEIYAINGTLYSISQPDRVYPGDSITYRLTASLSHQNVEDLIIYDYIPPPIMIVDNFNNLTINNPNATSPSDWIIQYGPNHTYHSLVTPNVTVNSVSNSLKFDFGTYQTETNLQGYEIDLLYTVVCNDEPVDDGLQMTNQMVLNLSNTMNNDIQRIDSTAVIIGEPSFVIYKNVVAVSSTDPNSIASVEPVLDASLTFGVPNDNGGYTSNNINTSYISSASFETEHYGDNLQGNDYVRYALIVENKGHYKGFDLTLTDTGNEKLNLINGSLNVTDGAGNILTHTGDLFDTGLVINNNQITSTNDLTGTNIVIITYDMQVISGVTLIDDVLNNTVEVTKYTSIASGQNFVKATISDSSLINISPPSVTKIIDSTSHNHTVQTDDNNANITIGESFDIKHTINVPIGSMDSVVLTDTVSTNYDISNVSISPQSENITSSLGAFNSGMFDGSNIFTIGNITNTGAQSETIEITYTALVSDHNSYSHNTTINEPAVLTYVGGNGNSNQNTDATVITIKEPVLNVSKTKTTSSHNHVGETVNYKITITNTGEIDAFDVVMTDTLPTEVTYSSSDFGSIDGSDFTYNIGTLEVGESKVVNITCTLNENLVSGVVITNTANIDWNSVTDTGSNVKRGYTDSNNTNIVSLPTITSTIANSYSHKSSTTKVTGTAIGDEVTYTVTFTAPKTTVHYDSITFNISGGVLTEETNQVTATANSVDLDIQSINITPQVSGATVTFPINTTVINSNRDLGSTESYTFSYVAKAKDDNSNVRGNNLNNNVNLSLSNYGNNISDESGTNTTTIMEPNISINKIVDKYPISINDYIDYTITVSNNSGSDVSKAFDLAISDLFDSNIFSNVTVTSNPDSLTDTSSYPNMTLSITELEVGSSVSFSLRATLNGATSLSSTIENTASVDFDSVSGLETEQRDYQESYLTKCYIGHPEIEKYIVNGDTTYAVGQKVEFGVRVRFQQGTTENVVIRDIVPDGLTLLSGTLDIKTTSTGPNGGNFNGTITGSPTYNSTNKEWSFGNVVVNRDENLDSDYVIFEFKLRVYNQLSNIDGTVLTNYAEVDYEDYNTTIQTITSNGSLITIVEPKLKITKERVDERLLPKSSSRYNELYDGQFITYQITVEHDVDSTSTAYNVSLSGLLPTGLDIVEYSEEVKSANTISNTTNTITSTYNSLTLGNSIVLTLSVKTDANTISGSLGDDLISNADITWRSANNGHSRDGTDGIGASGVVLDNYKTEDDYTVKIIFATYTQYDGTIMVEDIIVESTTDPLRHGDFDFNDIVVEYWVKEYLDQDDKVRYIIGDFDFLQQRAAYDHDFSLIIPGLDTLEGKFSIQRYNGLTKESIETTDFNEVSNNQVTLIQGVRQYLRREARLSDEMPSSVRLIIGFDGIILPTRSTFNNADPPYYPIVGCYNNRLSNGNPIHTVQYLDGSISFPKNPLPQILVLKGKHDMWTCIESTCLDDANPYFRTWIDEGQDINDEWFDEELHPPVEDTYLASITQDANLIGWKTRTYDM